MIGTLYPLALEAVTGQKISVGAPFFNYTFGRLILPVLIAIPFGQFLSWKRGDIAAVSQRLTVAFGLSVVIVFSAWWLMPGGPGLAPVGIGLGAWLIFGPASEIGYRIRLFRASLAENIRRAAGLPRSAWGTAAAHMGVGVTVIGIVAVAAWESERILVMKPGGKTELAGYSVEFLGTADRKGPNFDETVGRFAIHLDGARIATMESAKRLYTARRMPTTEAAIETRGVSQIYISMGDITSDGGLTVRIYHKPLVTLIWIGTLIMVFGGFLSLSDRRLRVGAPRQSKRSRLRAAEEAA